MNALLYNLFSGRQPHVLDTSVQTKYTSYAQLCRANLETALANLPLFLHIEIESVQALLLGVNSLLQ